MCGTKAKKASFLHVYYSPALWHLVFVLSLADSIIMEDLQGSGWEKGRCTEQAYAGAGGQEGFSLECNSQQINEFNKTKQNLAAKQALHPLN